MWAIEWAPFYPMALFEMHEQRDPQKIASASRHYLFEPMLAEQRTDQQAGVDKSTHATLGMSPVPHVPESFMTGWFQ